MLLLAMFSCTEEKLDLDGLAVLGFDNAKEEVLLTQKGDSGDGLNTPRDLAFNPARPGELWVVNRSDDSVSIFYDAGTADQDSEHLIDPFAEHFMEEVSSIAFGAPLTFGTCQESRNTYNGQTFGDNFMGPTLWTADMDIFAQTNDEAVSYLTRLFGEHVDLGSHLDMLHESPLCMGIAWEKDNVYWVFDGMNSDIVRYDFHEDHGPGYDDHSDGTIYRYAKEEVTRKKDVPSHMKLYRPEGHLYIADTGNNAVKILDITSGEVGASLPKNEPGTVHKQMENTDIWTVIDGRDHGMEAPSGLTIIDETLFVTDNATSVIHAFELDGTPVDSFQTGLQEGALMGIYASSIDDLWFTDAVDDKLWRLQPAGAKAKASAESGEYDY